MRRGVTLIELLIVILIMLMITAVTVAAISPALQGRKIREAARMVEVYLNSARNRAVADNKVVGVRFNVIQGDKKTIPPSPGEPSACESLSLVEQPDPWSGDFDKSKVLRLMNGGFGAWGPPDAMGNRTVSIDQPFVKGDVGWISNIAPGDLVTFSDDDTVQYRLYAGEPYIDVNGDGQWNGDAANHLNNEPFADVDGNGWYTSPNPLYIDPASGMFVANAAGQFPLITWGQPTAFITYTYADPVLAAKYMHPLGLDTSGNPIWLTFNARNSRGDYLYSDLASVDPTNSGNSANVLKNTSFTFIRRPIELSSAQITLPDGAIIDLGSNVVLANNDIVAAPGSGIDMLVPFSGGSSTLGNYATFRPNPICDHETNSTITPGNVNDYNRSVMVTFSPNGTVDFVYSWDERNFLNSTGSITPTTVPNFANYQGRLATSPIYFLIGKRELIDGDPDVVPKVIAGSAPIKPAYNFQDPDSLWVSINPRTGLITSAENVAPDLTQPPGGTTASQLQLYFNAQTYNARSIAREAFDMGGM